MRWRTRRVGLRVSLRALSRRFAQACRFALEHLLSLLRFLSLLGQPSLLRFLSLLG
jgi:hypothetical protein